ncbi:MAG: hypothetical protein Q4C64_01805 [Erysipelotrichia bacterium]|nr:hypothetical protein [Erysipelotrichia bacterium]
MKKIFICLAVLFLLIGCGSSDQDNNQTDKNNNTVQTEKTTIEQQEVYNAQGIIITAVEYVEKNGIKFTIENTTDKAMTVSADFIVDNCNVDDSLYAEIAAQSKKNETVKFDNLEKYTGDNIIQQIEMYFRIYDSSTLEDILTEQYCCIKTNKFGEITNGNLLEGTNVYEDDMIKIVLKKVDPDSFWGLDCELVIVNKSNSTLYVSSGSARVNGYSIDGTLYSELKPGKSSYESITFFSTELEENDITDIESISVSFHITNAETYDYYDTEYADLKVE